MAHAHVSSGGRYPVLRSVAILFMINAVIVVGTGAYWMYYFLTEKAVAVGDRFQLALLVLVATFFAVLLTVGLAELIKLFMDIEHNTRIAAHSADPTAKTWIEGEETAEGALIRGR